MAGSAHADRRDDDELQKRGELRKLPHVLPNELSNKVSYLREAKRALSGIQVNLKPLDE